MRDEVLLIDVAVVDGFKSRERVREFLSKSATVDEIAILITDKFRIIDGTPVNE